jgi:hypothetical protein
MFDAIAERGVQLVNDPSAYAFCHQLPLAYPTLEGHTPRTVSLPVSGPVDFARDGSGKSATPRSGKSAASRREEDA